MTKKTLYISDLDGTLLNSQSQVSAASRDMLNRLIADNDINFSIATARTPATVVQLMHGIDSRLPYIVMTGAAMWQDGLINQTYLRPEDVECLSELSRKYGIRPFFYTYNGRVIESYHLPTMDDYERRFVSQRRNSPYKRFLFQNSMPVAKKEHTMLVFVAGDYEKMGNVYNEAKSRLKCEMTYYRDIFNSKVGFLEVMAEGVSKARAVERLKQQVGADRVVVFGDSPNDLSMRKVADLFIAPSNAVEEVRHVADEVTQSNDDDCVARWIEKDIAARQ